MSLLQQLEQQYGTATAEITNKLIKITHSNNDERKALITDVESHFEDAKELLEQINLEIRELSPSDRKTHLMHLEGFQREYDKLKNDFKQTKQFHGESHVRLELFGDDNDDDNDNSDYKTRLLNDTQRLEASTRKLESGYKLCVESEEIGAQILNNMNSQRETITRARDRLRVTNYDLSKGTRFVNVMLRRGMQTRVMIYGITLLLSIAILYFIYDTVFHN